MMFNRESKGEMSVEDIGYQCSEAQSTATARKKPVDETPKGVSRAYRALFLWAEDKSIMEPRVLVKCELSFDGRYVYAKAIYGPIVGMNVTTPGGH